MTAQSPFSFSGASIPPGAPDDATTRPPGDVAADTGTTSPVVPVSASPSHQWAAYRRARSASGMTHLDWDDTTPIAADVNLRDLVADAVNNKLADMRAARNHHQISTVTAVRPHIDNPT